VCLLKSPFLLRQLMLQPTTDTLLGDDVGACLTPLDPPNLGAFTCCAPARSAGLTTPSAATHAAKAGAAHEIGSLPMDGARRHLDRMANGARHRQASVRHRLAPTGIPAVMGLEEPAPHRTTDRTGRISDPRSRSCVRRSRGHRKGNGD